MIFQYQPQTLTIKNSEILRYLGDKRTEIDEITLKQLEMMKKQCEEVIRPAVCYTACEIMREDDKLNIANILINSRDLNKNLKSCRRLVVFCATVGIGIDRLLSKYGRTDLFKCALVQAIGSAYAEALCNDFCAWLAEQEKPFQLRPRFSPGYGDFPLAAQKDIFSLLSPEKRLGVSLNNSLLMSPSKSVTAFVGIGEQGCEKGVECDGCNQTDCPYRR